MLIQKKLNEEGRRQVWLKKQLEDRGYKISRASLCNIARANSLPRDLRLLKEICEILTLDFEECLSEYSKKRAEQKAQKISNGTPQNNGQQQEKNDGQASEKTAD